MSFTKTENMSLANANWVRRWQGVNANYSSAEIIDSILAARGLVSEEDKLAFYSSDLSLAPDPFLLPDIEIGADAITEAIQNHEKIRIFGDYDADGITATALMTRALSALGANVDWFLPHRILDGYGLNAEALKRAKDEGVALVITVDNGVSAFSEIDLACELGLKVIITDHHEPQSELPKAFAVVNPKRADSKYPYRELAGVGVAYFLLVVICKKMGFKDDVAAKFLDLVTIGTIADSVPLTGVNRLMVKNGLSALCQENKKAGVSALLNALCLNGTVNSTDVAFKIAPKINAAGRVSDPKESLELLLTQDRSVACDLAQRLLTQNEERQALEARVIADAERKLEAMEKIPSFILLSDKEWHLGVVGIAASRIAEKYFRPTALLNVNEDGLAKGSLRTYGDFDLFRALDTNNEHLLSYGGHAEAAGMTANIADLTEISKSLELAADKFFEGKTIAKNIVIDAEIALSQVTVEFVRELKKLEPFGMGMEEPTFLLSGVRTASVIPRGTDGSHLAVNVQDSANNRTVSGIWFHGGSFSTRIKEGDILDVVCRLSINVWQDKESVQMVIKDIRVR